MFGSLCLLGFDGVGVNIVFANDAALTNDDGDTLADELTFQTGVHISDEITLGSAPSACCRQPVVWVVAVYLGNEVTADVVGRNVKAGECVPSSCRIGGDDEVTRSVVAPRGTDGIHKALGELVDGRIAAAFLGIRPRVGIVEHLVIAFEEQTLVVADETGGYLLPNLLEADVHLVELVDVGSQPMLVSRTAACVVVDVDDAVHVLADNIVDNLLYTFHP